MHRRLQTTITTLLAAQTPDTPLQYIEELADLRLSIHEASGDARSDAQFLRSLADNPNWVSGNLIDLQRVISAAIDTIIESEICGSVAISADAKLS